MTLEKKTRSNLPSRSAGPTRGMLLVLGGLLAMVSVAFEFSPTALAMLAVPADAKENRDALLEYAAEYNTPYEILVDLSPAQIESHNELIDRTLHSDATPCTVLADQDGNVLHTMLGVPSVSDVRRLLRTRPRQNHSTTSTTNQASNPVRLSSE